MPGGTRHFDFSKKLTEEGYNITIFASSFHYQKLKDIKEYKSNEYFLTEQVDGVRFVWFKTLQYFGNNYRRVLNMLSFSNRFLKYVRDDEYGEKPDIIIGSSVHLLAVLAAYKAAKILHSDFFMEVRDIWPQTLIDSGVSRYHPLVLWFRRIEVQMYKKAKKIIILLPKAKDHIMQSNVPEHKIVYLPNGVDITPFSFPKLNSKNKIFTIVYAGVIGVANNLQMAVETAKICKERNEEVFFNIIGEGQEKDRLIQLVNKFNLTNISFFGAVPKTEIADALAKADALFFNLADSPVYKYGLSSNKLFDYLAAGKPILFSCKAGNNPVEEAHAGISIEPDSPELLFNAIMEMKRLSDDERLQMGINGYKYVKKNHSMEILSKRFIEILNN
jgi:glycosyltransferase involved in cell wall biosynthesis